MHRQWWLVISTWMLSRFLLRRALPVPIYRLRHSIPFRLRSFATTTDSTVDSPPTREELERIWADEKPLLSKQKSRKQAAASTPAPAALTPVPPKTPATDSTAAPAAAATSTAAPAPLNLTPKPAKPAVALGWSLPWKPEEVEEAFVRGGGPGGQKINKVMNCVQLTHRPTGISTKCQQTRSLEANRAIARRTLYERLELILLGDESKLAIRAAKHRRRLARSKRRSNIKYRPDADADRDEEDASASESDAPIAAGAVNPKDAASADATSTRTAVPTPSAVSTANDTSTAQIV